jgi:hypothetical protein
VSLWGRYQRWAGQYPDESRWLPWVWGIFALFVAWVAWSLAGEWKPSHATASKTVAADPSRPLSLDQLKARLAAGDWGPADADTLELAFAAVLAGERRNSELEHGLWGLALSGCGHDAARIAVLRRLGRELNLKPEAAQADAYVRATSPTPRAAP